MRHKWQRYGGCSSNPGVYDSGTGGMIYQHICVHCGLIRERGEDYTGVRPGNTWGPVYKTPGGVRVGAIACDPHRIASIDAAEQRRRAAEAEARAAEARMRAEEARLKANYRTAISAILAARPDLVGHKAHIVGNADWTYVQYVPQDRQLRGVEYSHGTVRELGERR